MVKGDNKVRKHKSDDDSSGSDDEYEAPSYDDLATLLKKYTSIIRKPNEKIDKLKLKKKILLKRAMMMRRGAID